MLQTWTLVFLYTVPGALRMSNTQHLLTVAVTSLHRRHLGSHQSHRSNDLVLSGYFGAAIICRSSDVLCLSAARGSQWLDPSIILLLGLLVVRFLLPAVLSQQVIIRAVLLTWLRSSGGQ